MHLLALAWKSARARSVATLLTVLSIALSVALLVGVEKVRTGARAGFAQTVSGADLLVGARSGSVNLLLYAVFRIGDPTTNVSWQSFEGFSSRPDVAWAIPLSLGDSHAGFRVLGTTQAYFDHYRYGQRKPLEFATGVPFSNVYDAVLGASAAKKLGYELGREFNITHGLVSASFAEHADSPFQVVGVLKPTGTPVDRTIHISLAGLEAVHEGYNDGPPPIGGRYSRRALTDPAAVEPDSITAFLVGLKSRAGALRYQRDVNTFRGEAMTAVIPGVALSQMWRVVGGAEQALRAVSALVVVAGLAGLLTALLTSLNERRREIAVFRAVGAHSRDVFALLVLESALLTAAGAVLGVLLVNGLLLTFGDRIEALFGAPMAISGLSTYDLTIAGIVVCVGAIMGFLPGWLAYKRSLNDGLTVQL
ncbi:MAG: ABC transporter permease [Pseudomonadota bacterium]